MISGEKHYRPDELAELWGFSPKTIRGLFGEEPGVPQSTSPSVSLLRGVCEPRWMKIVIAAIGLSAAQPVVLEWRPEMALREAATSPFPTRSAIMRTPGRWFALIGVALSLLLSGCGARPCFTTTACADEKETREACHEFDGPMTGCHTPPGWAGGLWTRSAPIGGECFHVVRRIKQTGSGGAYMAKTADEIFEFATYRRPAWCRVRRRRSLALA